MSVYNRYVCQILYASVGLCVYICECWVLARRGAVVSILAVLIHQFDHTEEKLPEGWSTPL